MDYLNLEFLLQTLQKYVAKYKTNKQKIKSEHQDNELKIEDESSQLEKKIRNSKESSNESNIFMKPKLDVLKNIIKGMK